MNLFVKIVHIIASEKSLSLLFLCRLKIRHQFKIVLNIMLKEKCWKVTMPISAKNVKRKLIL